jgi:hypothetical protein
MPSDLEGVLRSIRPTTDLACVTPRPRLARRQWAHPESCSVAPSGRIFLEPNPGLKPWAVLLCHFVALAVSHVRPFAHSL